MFLGWNSDDQDKAVAYSLWKNSLCPSCGSDPQAWMDPTGKPLDDPPMKAATYMCHGCATLEEERELIPQDKRSQIRAYLVPS